jgi:hypothetical protein
MFAAFDVLLQGVAPLHGIMTTASLEAIRKNPNIAAKAICARLCKRLGFSRRFTTGYAANRR